MADRTELETALWNEPKEIAFLRRKQSYYPLITNRKRSLQSQNVGQLVLIICKQFSATGLSHNSDF